MNASGFARFWLLLPIILLLAGQERGMSRPDVRQDVSPGDHQSAHFEVVQLVGGNAIELPVAEKSSRQDARTAPRSRHFGSFDAEGARGTSCAAKHVGYAPIPPVLRC